MPIWRRPGEPVASRGDAGGRKADRLREAGVVFAKKGVCGGDPPDLQRRMSTLGFNLDFRNNDQFRELIVRDHQKYGAIIREAGIQPN